MEEKRRSMTEKVGKKLNANHQTHKKGGGKGGESREKGGRGRT
jgi:hypothetical protein